MSEISEAALARKKRFLAEKEKAGGAEKLMESNQERDWHLWFDKNGEIVCFTQQQDVVPNKDWLSHDFSQDQLKILVDNQIDLNKYWIKVDPHVDNLYSIEVKSIENVFLNSEKDFLDEIAYSKSALFDIKVSITNTPELVVEMNKKAKEPYKDVYPISATIKGQRLLKFFITAENDPHVLFHYEVISLAELITETKVKRKLPLDLRHCSIYTIKLFDKYQRS